MALYPGVGSTLQKVGQAMAPKVPAVGQMAAQPSGGFFSKSIKQLAPARAPSAPTMPNVSPIPASNALTGQPPVAPAPVTPLPMPVQSNTAQLSRINPSNDLRSVQIAPTAGPSRSEIAAKRLELLDRGQADQRKRGIQEIGRNAASLGRLNSGMVTTDLGNLEERLQELRERTLLGLSADTAEGEIQDARYDRGELRGERDFQTGRADNAIDQNVRQRMMEDALVNSQFGRNRALANAELDYSDQAGRASEGAFDALGELFRTRAAKQMPGSQQNILDEISGAKAPSTLPPVASANIPRSILDLLKVS